MKKIVIAFAAIAFGSTAAYAADKDMDCCKKCECCKAKKDEHGHHHPAPAPQPKG